MADTAQTTHAQRTEATLAGGPPDNAGAENQKPVAKAVKTADKALGSTHNPWIVFAGLFGCGLIVTCLLLALMAGFHKEVIEPHTRGIDTALMTDLHNHASPALTHLMFAFTDIGSPGPVFALLAVCLGCKLGDQEAAKQAFEEALRINPRFAKACFYLGVALYDLDRPREALQSIERAVELEPGFRTDLYEKALQAHSKSDYPTARDIFEQIGDTDVDDIAYHVRLGADLYRRGMYDQAIDEFGKALAINGNYADLRNHLAIAYNAK